MENNNNINSQNPLNSITSSMEQSINNNEEEINTSSVNNNANNINNNDNINQINFINENSMNEDGAGTNKNMNDSFYDAYEDDIDDFYFYDLEDNTKIEGDIYDEGIKEYVQSLWDYYYRYRKESFDIAQEIYGSVDEMYQNIDLNQLDNTPLKTAGDFKDRFNLNGIFDLFPNIFDLIATINTQVYKIKEQNWEKYANIEYGLFKLSSDWLIEKCINKLLNGLKNIKTWINESNDKILKNNNNSSEIITEVLNKINEYLKSDDLGLTSIKEIIALRKQKCLNIINESGVSPGIKNRKRTTDSEDKK